MKKALALILVFSLALVFCPFETLADSSTEVSPEPTGSTEETTGGINIPSIIVFAILAGAVALGGAVGYWFARKR